MIPVAILLWAAFYCFGGKEAEAIPVERWALALAAAVAFDAIRAYGREQR